MAYDVKAIKESDAPAAKLRQEHYNIMDVHINAEKPEDLLKARRPKESEDKYILQYRLANFRHTAKSLFDRALDNVIEILQKTNISEKVESTKLQAFLERYRKYSGGKYYTLREWLFTDVTRFSEVDASAILVVLPVHETPLTPTFEAELPVFSKGKPVANLDVILVDHSRIVTFSEDLLIFEAGDWVYKRTEKGRAITAKYYFVYTKNQLDIYYPKEIDGKIQMVAEGYYTTNAGVIPAQVLGNRYVNKTGVDKKKHKVFVSNFLSAALIADLYYGEISDTQQIGTKYHPIRFQYKTDCDAGCMPNEKNIYCDGEGNTCKSCHGRGKIIDFAVGDVYLMDKPTEFDQGMSDIKSPIGWVTPPAELLKLRHEIDEKYYSKIATELCINLEQNMTNASEGSKQIDREYKVTFVSNIVEAKVSWYENILRFCEMLMEYKPNPSVRVIRPRKYDVQSQEDILGQISEMKNAGAPDIIVMDSIRELLKHQWGFDERGKKIIDFIMAKDRLIAYGSTGLAQARALLGGEVISQRALDIHNLMYVVLNEVLAQNPEIELDYATLNAKFDEVLDKYAPAATTAI